MKGTIGVFGEKPQGVGLFSGLASADNIEKSPNLDAFHVKDVYCSTFFIHGRAPAEAPGARLLSVRVPDIKAKTCINQIRFCLCDCPKITYPKM